MGYNKRRQLIGYIQLLWGIHSGHMDILEDNRLFKQLGFTREFSFLLITDEKTFRDSFNDNVSDDVNFFGVSGHRKNFHGRIRSKTFEIYRPTKFVNNTSIAISKGAYQDIDSEIKVHLVTYIPMTMALLFYSMLFLITVIFNALAVNSVTPIIILVAINAFFIFFGLRIYFSFRNSVTTLTRDVEREMGFWMARVNALQQNV